MGKKNFMESALNDLHILDYYLRPNEDGEKVWKKHTKNVYDKSSKTDKTHSLARPSGALEQLYIEGLDNEQLWQQVELLNKSCIDNASHATNFNESNLSSRVGYLEIIGSKDPSLGLFIESEQKVLDDIDEDEAKDEVSDSASDEFDEDESRDEGLGSGDDQSEDEQSELEDERNNLTDSFDEGSEGDFKDIALEDDDDDDESDEDEEIQGLESVDKPKKQRELPVPPSFTKTSVDSQFLQVRESEWVADNDMLGENCGENFEDVDFMEDIEDTDEEEIMYKDFFDEVPNEKESKLPNKEHDESGGEGDESDTLNEDRDEGDTEVNNTTVNHESDDETITPLLGGKNKQIKSLYEKMTEHDQKNFEVLEENNIGDKEWVMKGEVQSADRPENSVLEENLEYTVTASQRPTTTEETTEQLEKFITGVLRSGAFDDVERRVKPINDPNDYKKKLLLDQGKSKMSLAEIYEQEYLAQKESNKNDADEEESEEHKEIKSRMTRVFTMLDALANYHYTPRQKNAEVKIVSNLPALSMEESAPVSASDATLLAPQEIVASRKGEIEGKTEQTSTDKKRDRRKKKSFQKKKAHVEDMKMKKKLQKMSKEGKTLDVSTSAKVVEKAIKRGQVKLMEQSSSKAEKSFKDKKSSSKRKLDETGSQKKKKSRTNLESSTKLLL